MGGTGRIDAFHSDFEEWGRPTKMGISLGRQIRIGVALKFFRPKIKTGQH